MPTLQQFNVPLVKPADALLKSMEFKDRARRTDIAQDRNQIAREGQGLQREAFEFNKMKSNLAMGNQHLPALTKQEYPDYLAWVKKIGAPVEFLPQDVSDFSDQEFEGLKQRIYMGADKIGQMNVEQYKSVLVEGRERISQENRIKLEQEKQRGRVKLAQDKDPKTLAAAWLKNNPNPSNEDIVNFNDAMKTKMRAQVGADGSIVFEMGGSNIGTTKKALEKEIETLRGTESSATDLIGVASDIQKEVASDPTVIGTTGWAQRKIDSIGSQLEGLVKTIAPRSKIKTKLDPNKYDWKSLSSDAAKSATIKSKIIKLAYMVARLREPDARQFSDADIQRAIEEIGGSTGSPEQMNTVLDTIMVDAIRGLNRKSKLTTGEDYIPPDMDPETIKHFESQGIPRERIIIEHLKKYGK